jgi:hypothetical protein
MTWEPILTSLRTKSGGPPRGKCLNIPYGTHLTVNESHVNCSDRHEDDPHMPRWSVSPYSSIHTGDEHLQRTVDRHSTSKGPQQVKVVKPSHTHSLLTYISHDEHLHYPCLPPAYLTPIYPFLPSRNRPPTSTESVGPKTKYSSRRSSPS